MGDAVDVRVEATIEQAVDVVAAFAGDPSNAPRWYRRIGSADWETEPPMQIGSRIAFEARFMGRDMAYTYEVVEWVPGERLTMSTAQGPFPMTTEYTWVAVGEGSTLMTLRNHGRPTGWSRWMASLLSGAMRRAMRQDLENLTGVLKR